MKWFGKKEDPSRPEESTQDAALIEAKQVFIDSLAKLGITSFAIGYSIDDEADGSGSVSLQGSGHLILNIIAGMIKSLVPEDFHNLLVVMLQGDYFAAQRGNSVVVEKVKATGIPQKTEWMN